MNEAIRVGKSEGTKGSDATPASTFGLGDGAVTSVAATILDPTIIITMAKRGADAYLDLPAILARNSCYNNLMQKIPNPKHNSYQ